MEKIKPTLHNTSHILTEDLLVAVQECPVCGKRYVPTPKSKDMCIRCKFKKPYDSKTKASI